MSSLWHTKKLSDVCEKITDGTHQTPKYFESGHIFLSSKNVTSGKIDWDNIKYIDDAQHEAMQKRISPRRNDILLAKNGTTGVAAIVDKDVNFDIYVSLAFLRPLNILEPRFLLYFVNSPIAKKQFNKRLKGIGVPNLHLKEIRDVEIYFPDSLEEQKRIVAILDQTIADIEQARAKTEQNLKNARELFESYLQQVFSQCGEGWVEFELKNAVELKSGTTVKKEIERDSGDVSYIKVAGMNLKGNEIEITTSNLFLNYEDINNSNILPIGTIIFPKRGGAIATNKKRITAIPLCIDLNTMGVIPKLRFVLPLYIYFYFKTFDLLTIANGTTIPQINNYSFDGLTISIPSLERQLVLIEEMYKIQSKTNDLSLVYTEKLKALDELKKSILQKAFTGELTSNKNKGAAA